MKKNTKIIILSHIGRPKGKIINDLSLKPICEDLGNKLNQNVNIIAPIHKNHFLKQFPKNSKSARFSSPEELQYFQHHSEVPCKSLHTFGGPNGSVALQGF